MTFHVGQKVVCVDDDATHFLHLARTGLRISGSLDGLKKGTVYTVRAAGYRESFPGVLCVWLEEIIRPATFFGEAPYIAARFRPVVERKTCISVFTAMLDRAPPAPVVTPQKELETQ
jgi:hypothetical protein